MYDGYCAFCYFLKNFYGLSANLFYSSQLNLLLPSVRILKQPPLPNVSSPACHFIVLFWFFFILLKYQLTMSSKQAWKLLASGNPPTSGSWGTVGTSQLLRLSQWILLWHFPQCFEILFTVYVSNRTSSYQYGHYVGVIWR